MSDFSNSEEPAVGNPKIAGNRDLTRRVAEFYDRFPFPGQRHPDGDGLVLMRHFAALIGSLRQRSGTARLRVLDAGCGTGNTSIGLARAFPDLDILGVDICDRSLSIAREAAAQAELTNVHFQIVDLMHPMADEGPFAIVLCLGVLHHTVDMARALANLETCLDTDGRLFLWVYGRHGRYRHSLNRRLLGLLFRDEPDPSARVTLAKDFATGMNEGEPLRDLYGFVPGKAKREQVVLDEIWVADQFLNVHEQVVDIEQLMALLSHAGLTLVEWLNVDKNVSRILGSAALTAKYESLTPRERLLALDLILKPARYFVIAAPGRNGRLPR
jgi:SAM-dependent methyltransferase